MFTKVILNHSERELDFNQGGEQSGFRSGFNTMDRIQTLNEVIENTNEFVL